MAAKKSVLILGGGFGGLRVALDLEKDSNFSISLVDVKLYHSFTPELFEIIYTAPDFSKKIGLEKVSGVVKIPIDEIFKNKKVNFVCDLVTSVDLKKSEVKLNQDSLSYDVLVLALGSTTSYFSIPGAKEHSYPFKSLKDVIKVRNEITWELSLKDELNVLVAGGGFTGVGLAGALAELAKNIHQKNPQKRLKIMVLEGLGNLLTGMSPWAQELIFKKLQDAGVNIFLDSKILSVKRNSLLTENKGEIAFDYLIWTAGVMGESLSGRIEGAGFDPKHQIVVESDLSLEGFENVFVVGDLASTNSPQAAWAAIEQAKTVVENIQRQGTGGSIKIYKSPPDYFIIPINQSYSVSNVFGLRLTGILATVLKKVVILRYLLSILSFKAAFKYFIKGVRVSDLDD